MIGRVIGNYKIEQKLGEGGMGTVYKGVDTMLDREVAIKALRPELASQTTVVERFRSEAVTLAKLHHPNIATLYALFRQTDELYMVLEYVRGETLDAILQRRGALPAEEVIPVFCQILDGINHAHELGIIHRDIKPANMMLTERGTLKVLDFGIARLLGSNRMTRAGNVIGTLEYMAPEQVKGQETDARTDIYALGMMLYEILTGRLPFESDNEFELMKLQTEAMPAPPRAFKPAIPEEVEEAIMRAIRKDPDERFQTAGELRETLLDAGFAAQGKLRRSTNPQATDTPVVTGDRTAAVSTGNAPAVSKPEPMAEERTTGSENVIKETRLGGVPAANPHEIKETRLGGGDYSPRANNAAAFVSTYDEEPPASFFNQLSWVHYAGAGAGGLVVIVMLVVVSIFAFGGGQEPEKPIIQARPTAAPTAQQAAATPLPTATVTPIPAAQTVAEQPATPSYVAPISTPEAEEKPAASAPSRSASATRKATPSQTRRPSRTPKPDARCLLTGDC